MKINTKLSEWRDPLAKSVIRIKQRTDKMTKFEITIETKQVWRAQVEAKTLDEARAIRDEFYDYLQGAETIEALEQNVQMTHEPAFKCIEAFGGDDLSDDDIKTLQDLTKMETTKAFRCDGAEGYVDTAWCPYCKAENTNELILGGTDKQSTEFDTLEANAKMFECNCFNCGQVFRVDYFKEV